MFVSSRMNSRTTSAIVLCVLATLSLATSSSFSSSGQNEASPSNMAVVLRGACDSPALGCSPAGASLPVKQAVHTGSMAPVDWPSVQVVFLVETTPYDGVFDPTDTLDYGLDPCLAGGATHPCEESNGVTFFLHYAQEIADGIAAAHPETNVSFALVDYFSTLGDLDDGDGASVHVDVANFTAAGAFGDAVNATFGTTVLQNGTYPDSDMNDSLLHSSAITALYGVLAAGLVHWSNSAHHVVIQIGSTAPRDPAYVENYSVSASRYAEYPPSYGLLGSTCEPSYPFQNGGVSPNCEGWIKNQDGNATHSIAALASRGITCTTSLGGTCTIDAIDLWTTSTDPTSPGWPAQFASNGGGPNGTVVESDVDHVLAAGCDIANATGGTWDGPTFSGCMGQNGTLNFTGLNAAFAESTRLYHALLNVGFGNPASLPTYSLSFQEAGLANGTAWTVAVDGVSRSASTQEVTFSEWNGTHSYIIGPVTGFTASPSSGSVNVSGTNQTVPVTFLQILYAVTFLEQGLPNGRSWSVSLGAQTDHSISDSIAFLEGNGSYSYAIPDSVGYSPVPANGNIGVEGAGTTLDVTFTVTPPPLSVNFTSHIDSAICSASRVVTNEDTLNASAKGGTPPYSYRWTFPAGTASGPEINITFTWGENNTVSLVALDASGNWANHSAVIGMAVPSCPPPYQATSPPNSPSQIPWAVIGFGVGAIALGTAAAWVVLRRRKGGSREGGDSSPGPSPR